MSCRSARKLVSYRARKAIRSCASRRFPVGSPDSRETLLINRHGGRFVGNRPVGGTLRSARAIRHANEFNLRLSFRNASLKTHDADLNARSLTSRRDLTAVFRSSMKNTCHRCRDNCTRRCYARYVLIFRRYIRLYLIRALCARSRVAVLTN